MTEVIVRCTNASCSTTAPVDSKVINYDLVGDFIQYYNTLARTPVVTQHEDGSFGNTLDTSAGNFCSGWDPNDDQTADEFVNGANQSNLKQRTGLDGNPIGPPRPAGSTPGQATRRTTGASSTATSSP